MAALKEYNFMWCGESNRGVYMVHLFRQTGRRTLKIIVVIMPPTISQMLGVVVGITLKVGFQPLMVLSPNCKLDSVVHAGV